MKRHEASRVKKNIIIDLEEIDKALDQGIADDADASRDENSKFFHGVVNKRRSQLAIREELERHVSHDEIKRAVWDCGDNKSLGPDGFTFEFFKTYWDFVGQDFCAAVEHFFAHGSFAKGCNSSFIALIPKIIDAKFVNDFCPISLIGCVYKPGDIFLMALLSLTSMCYVDYIVGGTSTHMVGLRSMIGSLGFLRSESRDAIFDEERFTSIPRPRGMIQPSLSKIAEDEVEGIDDVPGPSVPRKSTRTRKAKSFGSDFQLYLVEGTRHKTLSQREYCFIVEEDPRTLSEAMASRDIVF
uniref:RNA-directed DNA polymerase, eukaryota, reverse transcriptase zinc-binding domain protein n=1 Tax=Tanacetum cinerariifolium TaxID=118510 RepID=A0A6L2P0I8_TANCI|nr:RNA-directed DNA polymerase, eukaryota, reverse transcriptase zinc-binding domain protein [Tanacetum cinerariifolium]